MKFMLKYIIIMMVFAPLFVEAQQTKDLLKAYFAEVASGQYPPIPKHVTLPENAKSTLSALQLYLADSSTVVRAKAYAITQLAGNNSRQGSICEDAVRKLVEAIKDEDSGNVGLALGYLTAFRKEDFTSAAKDTIRNIFYRKPAHFDSFLKLVGFLEMNDLKENIRPYTQKGNIQSVRWAAIVTLARMGDESAIQDMMTRVKKLPLNDDVVYEVFPDLIYTRQREAIEFIVTVMKSDEKNCSTADAERETAIPCGYRIMEQLAPAIEDYPFTLDESGDIKVKDYVEALTTVREWFVKNPAYEIDRDKY